MVDIVFTDLHSLCEPLLVPALHRQSMGMVMSLHAWAGYALCVNVSGRSRTVITTHTSPGFAGLSWKSTAQLHTQSRCPAREKLSQRVEPGASLPDTRLNLRIELVEALVLTATRAWFLGFLRGWLPVRAVLCSAMLAALWRIVTWLYIGRTATDAFLDMAFFPAGFSDSDSDRWLLWFCGYSTVY